MESKSSREQKCMIVSANLTHLRNKKFPGRGGSKKCADALGIKQQQWSPWEKGQTLPSGESLEKIAAFFEVPLEYLTTDNSASQNVEPVQAAASTEKASEQTSEKSLAIRIGGKKNKGDQNQLTLINIGNMENLQAILKLKISVEGFELVT